MKNSRYEKICNLHKAEENRGKNAFLAFLSGGVIGLLGEGMIEVLCFYFSFSRNDASSIMIVSFIFFACLFTGLGFFDRCVHIFRSGFSRHANHSMMVPCAVFLYHRNKSHKQVCPYMYLFDFENQH
jgi:hypothetical protein